MAVASIKSVSSSQSKIDQITSGFAQCESDDAEADENRLVLLRKSQCELILLKGLAAPETVNTSFTGSGNQDDPIVVGWLTPYDPFNPTTFSPAKKWLLTVLVGVASLAVAFCTTAYSGSTNQLQAEFPVSDEVIVLGISLFVLGFAIGPLLWAPLSELYGRQPLYAITFGALTAFNAGLAVAGNIQTILILRFFAGTFGVSIMTNCGGTVADLFHPAERGLAMIVMSVPGFMGPVLGPITSGFLSEAAGWRWVQGCCTIFTGVLWLCLLLLVPETYGPVLLRKRARQLSSQTGLICVSKMDLEHEKKTLSKALRIALTRPWSLLIHEPIVLLLSFYLAIAYGTLYLFFEGFPIVYQEHVHWSAGVGGLAFVGPAIGMLLGCLYAGFDNRRYLNILRQCKGYAPPESRLPPVMVGGIAMPIGLFWFAWTNSESVHWAVSITGSGIFGFGFVLVYLGVLNYMIDAYTIFAASTLAANVVLRYIFGAVFPLFARYMYNGLGIHWASSVPAFLSLACVPMPFLFYRYGAEIRQRCKFGAESASYTARLMSEKRFPLADEIIKESKDVVI